MPGGAEFREAVAKEVALVQQRHAQREAELEEKVGAGRSQYGALEDEFRMALTIEAARFSEVGRMRWPITGEKNFVTLFFFGSHLNFPQPPLGGMVVASWYRRSIQQQKRKL